MSVRDNIAFGLSLRKVPRPEQEATINRVAKLLQIEALLDRKPAQLSGGQRQRVAMGRALAREPQIFLFDEPLSNLDAKLRVEMRSEIKLLHKRLGITTVYVTHDQIEAMTLGDKIAVMKDGVVQQFGTPSEIYHRPANTFVAGFMGSPPMNLIPATLQAGAKGLMLRFSVGRATSGESAPEMLLALPENAARGDIAALVEKPVLLGLRPEHMSDSTRAETEQRLTVPVELSEVTGADTLLFTTLGGARVVCRVHPETVIDDDRVTLSLDTSRAVLFDPVTGLAL